MTKSPKIKKPKKHVDKKGYYNYREVTDYLQKLHGKDFQDFAGKYSLTATANTPYLNFWHWSTDRADISNGCWYYMPELHKSNPAWVQEILGHYKDFLGKDFEEKLWLDW